MPSERVIVILGLVAPTATHVVDRQDAMAFPHAPNQLPPIEAPCRIPVNGNDRSVAGSLVDVGVILRAKLDFFGFEGKFGLPSF